MRNFFRRLTVFFGTCCLALCLAVVWFRVRSADTTDVLMFAFPGDRCALVTSNEGQWMKLTVLDGWPDRGVKWWSARRGSPAFSRRNTWQESGPFLFWQNAPSSTWGPSGSCVAGSPSPPTTAEEHPPTATGTPAPTATTLGRA